MTRIARAAVAAATTAMLAVLTGCGSTDTTVGTPTALSDSAGPTGVDPAGTGPVQPVAEQTVFPAAAAPADGPDTTISASAGAAVESVGAGR